MKSLGFFSGGGSPTLVIHERRRNMILTMDSNGTLVDLSFHDCNIIGIRNQGDRLQIESVDFDQCCFMLEARGVDMVRCNEFDRDIVLDIKILHA